MAPTTNYTLPIGDLVGKSIAIFLRNLFPFTLLGVLFMAPWIALHIYHMQLLGEAPPRRHGETPDTALLMLPFAEMLLQSLLSFLLTGAVTFGVVQQLRGQPAGIAQVISKGLSSFGRVFATGFLCGLRIMLFTLLLIVPGIIQQVKLYVAIPAAVMEGRDASHAMSRSELLTKGSGWQIFGAWLLILLIGFGLAMVAFFVAHAADPGVLKSPVWVDIAITVFVGPFGATMMAVAYFLLRKGKENVDPKEIAAVFD